MSRRPARPHRGWLVGLALAVAVVLCLTLWPTQHPEYPGGTNLKPLEHHGRALKALLDGHPNRKVIRYYLLTDVLGNVALFAPFGFALAGAAGRRRPPAVRLAAATGFGMALSISVELLQLVVPGRATDVDDVIFNTLGALVGAAVLLVGERALGRLRRGRRRGRSAPS